MKELEKKLAKYFRLLAYFCMAIGLGLVLRLIIDGNDGILIRTSIGSIIFGVSLASLIALSVSGLGKEDLNERN